MLEGGMPEYVSDMPVYDAQDIDAIKGKVDFVFCAINLDKAATRELETKIRKGGDTRRFQ